MTNPAGAYELGRTCERCQAAARVAELRAGWRPYRRPTHADFIGRLVSEMEINARRFAQYIGRPHADWPGGSAEEALAWCRDRDASAYDRRYA